MRLVQRWLLSVFICVAGDHRVRPEHVHCVLLPELRLQSGSRVHRRIHFPFDALKRPEWNIRWRTLPQTHGRTRLTSDQHVRTLTWPLVLQKTNLYSFLKLFYICIKTHTSLVLKPDYSIYILDLIQYICWLLTSLWVVFCIWTIYNIYSAHFHTRICVIDMGIQYGYGGVWIWIVGFFEVVY